MFDRDRTCPICHGNSHIHVKIEGSVRAALEIPSVKCGKCGYHEYFLNVGLISYFGNAAIALAGVLLFISYRGLAVSPFILVGLGAAWIFIVPYLWLGIFVKTNLFSGYIDRRILKWARVEEETERLQQLINSDKEMRRNVLQRFMAVLSAITVTCFILTAILILRIALRFPGDFTDYLLLMVLGVAYLMIGMEWKEKLETWRKKDRFLVRSMYFIPKCAVALECIVAGYAAFEFIFM